MVFNQAKETEKCDPQSMSQQNTNPRTDQMFDSAKTLKQLFYIKNQKKICSKSLRNISSLMYEQSVSAGKQIIKKKNTKEILEVKNIASK